MLFFEYAAEYSACLLQVTTLFKNFTTQIKLSGQLQFLEYGPIEHNIKDIYLDNRPFFDNFEKLSFFP